MLPSFAAIAELETDEPPVFVIGGAALFAEALPVAQDLHLTRVHARPEGDTFLPEIDFAEWQLIEEKNMNATTATNTPTPTSTGEENPEATVLTCEEAGFEQLAGSARPLRPRNDRGHGRRRDPRKLLGRPRSRPDRHQGLRPAGHPGALAFPRSLATPSAPRPKEERACTPKPAATTPKKTPSATCRSCWPKRSGNLRPGKSAEGHGRLGLQLPARLRPSLV